MSTDSVISYKHRHSPDSMLGRSPDSMLGKSPDSYMSGWSGGYGYSCWGGYGGFREPSEMHIPSSDMEQLKRAIMVVPENQVPSVILNANMRLGEKAFTTLIQMCGKQRQWLRAEQVFHALRSYPNLEPNTYSYSALISALSQSGQQKRALHYFDLQLQASKLDTNCVPNQHTYSSAITAAERAGLPEKAWEIYVGMGVDGVKPDHVTYSAILSCCQKHGFWEEGAQVIDAMESEGISPSLGQYHQQLRQYACERNSIMALDLFLSMQEIGQQPTLITCQIALDTFQQGGNAEYALNLLEEMLDKQYDVDITCFNSVLHTISNKGDFQQVRKVYEMLENLGYAPNAQTAKHVINCHFKCEESLNDGWLSKVQRKFDRLGLMITLDEKEEENNDEMMMDGNFDCNAGNFLGGESEFESQSPPPPPQLKSCSLSEQQYQIQKKVVNEQSNLHVHPTQ